VKVKSSLLHTECRQCCRKKWKTSLARLLCRVGLQAIKPAQALSRLNRDAQSAPPAHLIPRTRRRVSSVGDHRPHTFALLVSQLVGQSRRQPSGNGRAGFARRWTWNLGLACTRVHCKARSLRLLGRSCSDLLLWCPRALAHWLEAVRLPWQVPRAMHWHNVRRLERIGWVSAHPDGRPQRI
jgi:hypothetical protein